MVVVMDNSVISFAETGITETLRQAPVSLIYSCFFVSIRGSVRTGYEDADDQKFGNGEVRSSESPVSF